jgi:hypothetical protein
MIKKQGFAAGGVAEKEGNVNAAGREKGGCARRKGVPGRGFRARGKPISAKILAATYF